MAIDKKPDYRRYRRYFVNLAALYQKKEVIVYTGLTLSFLAIAFFGLLALRPTLVTIANLLKELEDKKEINQKLQTKINNLNQAQVSYSQVAKTIVLVDQALPQNHSLTEIVYQIEVLAQKSSLTLRSVAFESVNLQGQEPSKKAVSKTTSGLNEIIFSLTASGEFTNLQTFLASLENLRRIITIDSFSLSQVRGEETPIINLNLSGKAYYLAKETK